MIIRTYQCNQCGAIFEVAFDHGDDPVPDCPACSVVLEWKPKSFAIATNKSRAVDLTQKIVEEDYGMTDMNDRNREGDIAAKMPVETTAAREERVKMEREIAEMAAAAKIPADNTPAFWAGQSAGAPAPSSTTAAALLASGKVGPAADVNPMRMLHEGIKSGAIPRKERIIASWKP